VALAAFLAHSTRVSNRLSSPARLGRFALASLCGTCFGVAAPPSRWTWLVWVAWLPLLAVLRHARPAPREAFALGLVAGLGVGLFGFGWIADFVENFAGFPHWFAVFGLFVYAFWLAVPYGFFALGASLGPERGWLSFLWPVALSCAVLELWPVVFPYTPAIGLASVPAWIQLAELGGPRLVEAQALVVALCALRALLPDAPGVARRALYATAALALPLASLALGNARMSAIEREASSARSVAIGLIQPNTPTLFADRAEATRRLRADSLRAEAEGADLVIWPEAGTYPFALERPLRTDSIDPRARINVERTTPTVFGVVTLERGDPYPYNSTAYLTPQGEIRGVFDKVELLIFGEYVPLIDFELARRLLPTLGQVNRGAGPVRFDVELSGGRRVAVGPVICFEDILPDFTRRVAAQPEGIELFVNTTIDGWYGDTKEPWEHLALAQFRSVEHRIPLVRSVSTGVSAVVDATGRTVAFLPPRITPPGAEPRFDGEFLVARVALARTTLARPTLFARFGWRYPQLCIAFCVVLAGVAVAARARRRSSAPQPTPRLET
jgi:apolipoprotein N-acyltransferase